MLLGSAKTASSSLCRLVVGAAEMAVLSLAYCNERQHRTFPATMKQRAACKYEILPVKEFPQFGR